MRLAAVVWGMICLWGVAGGRCADVASVRVADGFDFPVGPPDGDGYYRFRGFRKGGHRGEDWNGLRGGNSDLGLPVYSIAHGIVLYARDALRAWGNVVVVRHAYLEKGKMTVIDSLYGHLGRVTVREGQRVKRGQQVGTIGSNREMYTAHLHFEIHKNLAIGTNGSVAKADLNSYHLPTPFISAHRKLDTGPGTCDVPINTFARSGSSPSSEGPLRKGEKEGDSKKGEKGETGTKRSSGWSWGFRVNRYDDIP